MSTSQRLRKLTFKAKTNFDETSEKMKDKCDTIWFQIEDLMITLKETNS